MEIESWWNRESSVYYTWPKIFLPCTYLIKCNFLLHLETIIVNKHANCLNEISRTQDSHTPMTCSRFHTSSQIDPPLACRCFWYRSRCASSCMCHLVCVAICPKCMNTVVVPCVWPSMISAPDPHKCPSKTHWRKYKNSHKNPNVIGCDILHRVPAQRCLNPLPGQSSVDSTCIAAQNADVGHWGYTGISERQGRDYKHTVHGESGARCVTKHEWVNCSYKQKNDTDCYGNWWRIWTQCCQDRRVKYRKRREDTSSGSFVLMRGKDGCKNMKYRTTYHNRKSGSGWTPWTPSDTILWNLTMNLRFHNMYLNLDVLWSLDIFSLLIHQALEMVEGWQLLCLKRKKTMWAADCAGRQLLSVFQLYCLFPVIPLYVHYIASTQLLDSQGFRDIVCPCYVGWMEQHSIHPT
jgi:hypothetical protein